MKKILIVFIAFMPLMSWSQETVFGHLTFQLPVAIGEFEETSNPTVGAGARLNFYLRPTPTFPLQLGLDIGVFNRGHASETLPLNIAGFENDFKVNARNGVGNFGLLLKLEPLSGKQFSPYLEGEVGGNVFYSTAYFYRKNKGGDPQSLGRNDDTKGRWASFFGGSAGLKIALGEKRIAGIELKCAYFRGGETSYNAKPRFSEGVIVFERLKSRTDMFVPQIGMWVDFRKADEEEKVDK